MLSLLYNPFTSLRTMRLPQDGMEVDDGVIVAEIPSAMGSSASAGSSPSAKSTLVRIHLFLSKSVYPQDYFLVKRRVQDLERRVEVLDIQEERRPPQEETQDSVAPFRANGSVSIFFFIYFSCSCLSRNRAAHCSSTRVHSFGGEFALAFTARGRAPCPFDCGSVSPSAGHRGVQPSQV